MDNVINFEDYKKKNEGGFAPVTVEKQREQIEKQRQEIAEQRKKIQNEHCLLGKQTTCLQKK